MIPRDRPTPGPTYMTNDQQASYLDSLRKTKLARPTGSRPAPPSRFGGLKRSETQANVVAPIQPERPALPTSNSMPVMSAPRLLHKRTESNVSAKGPFAGRALVRAPSAVPSEDSAATSSDVQTSMRQRPDMPYMESGTRWMEKQEVRSLRMALEDMDMEEEKKLHSAAQDEAAELVWKHKHPVDAEAAANAPYANPDMPRDYRQHLRKGSYQRSHSQNAVPMAAQRIASGGSRSTSGGSQSDMDKPTLTKSRKSMEVLRKVSPPSGISVGKNRRTPSGKSYGGLAEAVANDIAQAHRRTSSGSKKRILSGEKKMFMNPNDRIWEDPQEDHSSPARPNAPVDPPIIAAVVIEPPTYVRKNPFARVRMQAEKLDRSNSEPIMTIPSRPSSIDIQRNPPSQSRRPWYMSNEPLPPTPPSAGDRDADEVPQKVTPIKASSEETSTNKTPTQETPTQETPTKDGKEIRSDDIRAATSKQRSDYSPKLPRPTVVSDKPGRPIVSFKQDWRPKEIVLEEKQSPLGRTSPKPDFTLSRSQTEPHPSSGPRTRIDAVAPPLPTIVVPNGPSIPSIVLPEEPEFAEPADFRSGPMTPTISVEPPSINVSGPEEPEARSARAPHPQHQPSGRPLPHHAATSPLPKSRPHYTPSIRQSGTLCAHCALPIAGRILSAAGERFHPGCFVCHQCHTNLELVAFYPEPENKRSERIDRISARQSRAGLALPEGTTDEEAYNLEYADGDPSLRFYCHLDFHELFSPRCKSCKTPIEGEVIVACGAEWHAGHFFCAQCGDPFDSSTPFVEKDGYAWCVGCHTNRYSSKCRKCKKPVIDTVVKALGYDWHGGCFVCVECSGEFQDGRYFLRGDSQDPVCVKCEERRLKA